MRQTRENTSLIVPTAAVFIEPLPDTLICSPDDKLGSVLSSTDSSHIPFFVFEDDKFLGLVSPYHEMFQKRRPRLTKVRSALIQPYGATAESPLTKMVDFMLESHLYVVPVFDQKGQVAGVVKADTIFQHLSQNQEWRTVCNEILSWHPPVTASDKENKGTIYTLCKSKKISRVVLVNDDGQVAGIIARRDLEEILLEPSPRQRFRSHQGNYDHEGATRFSDTVISYATTEVVTLREPAPPAAALDLMLERKVNSIILVTGDDKPTGFLSKHDFLKVIQDIYPVT